MSDLYYPFPNGDCDIYDRVKYLRDHADALKRAASTLPRTGGNEITVVHDMARLYASFADVMELLAKSIPYKKGDRVRLVRAPKCEGGWFHCKHFLVVGAVATVHSVELDYKMRDWHLNLVFDDESWIAISDYPRENIKKGDVVKIDPDNRHTFRFAPDFVEPFHRLSPASEHDPGDEQWGPR